MGCLLSANPDIYSKENSQMGPKFWPDSGRVREQWFSAYKSSLISLKLGKIGPSWGPKGSPKRAFD